MGGGSRSSSIYSESKSSSNNYLEVKCKCGFKASIRRSTTVKNPGRYFYGCGNYIEGGCDFFRWVDRKLSYHPLDIENEKDLFFAEIRELKIEITQLKKASNTMEINMLMEEVRSLKTKKRAYKNQVVKDRRVIAQYKVALVLSWMLFFCALAS